MLKVETRAGEMASEVEVTYHQGWWPEFDPQDQKGGRRELLQIVLWPPDIHNGACVLTNKHMHTHTQIILINNKI